MFVTLDDERMLGLWREGAGLEPALADASIERFDGLDINRILRTAMRSWYIDYLVRAPLDMVRVDNLTDYARISRAATSDTWTVSLSCETARIVSVTLRDTGHIPLLNPDDPAAAPVLTSLANRFVRHGAIPVGLCRKASNTVTVFLNPEALPVIREVRGVMIPEDDTFVVDERALAQIPDLAHKALYSSNSLIL